MEELELDKLEDLAGKQIIDSIVSNFVVPKKDDIRVVKLTPATI